ncbi:MAG: hypothetical protein AUJ96_08375 [Armatimonadetes bacterium CG2_30_66_41]|nr:hypothetical protein [Armatimonadota bacterium]OIP06839.1 MAG: hypothetical protein AUJ96_08375 [Armatimonadetes bacterium CG2_30_66_41]PIU91149.1 MAG: hypothetical protein COS65_22880 [Armatimonadetes bacterium CG06_land_8_20_14_3_00_66_21]NCP32992.1 hypothetical protein [Armatimonadota bacterium]NCQ32377.1 hypothetical protein [Armatimonadota bacterium]
MDAKTAFDTKLKPKLEESFGADLTTSVLSTHAGRLGINPAALAEDQYLQLVDAIVQDARVIQMWGEAKTKFQALAWRGALRM